MTIEYHCECGRFFAVGDEFAGRKARCRQCGRVTVVPRPGGVDAGFDGFPRLEPARRRPILGPYPIAGIVIVASVLGMTMVYVGGAGKKDEAAGKAPASVPVAAPDPTPPVEAVDAEPRAAATPAETAVAPSPRPAAALTVRELLKLPLIEARKGHKTRLTRGNGPREPAPIAPRDVFTTLEFPSAVGPLKAYLTPNPRDGRRRPAIIWITGGDCNSIGEVWEPADPSNDQTAAAYRKAGIVMMFPSLRGGNDNPGTKEGFLGEVDDVIAAFDYLSTVPYVDPGRIYLGGHSTGGTLAMLVAEATSKFRAVFSFGPAHDVRGYGDEYCPFDLRDEREVALRSPGFWLNSVTSPLFVFEGESEGNVDSLRYMQTRSSNPAVHFFPIRGTDHFGVLAPVNKLIVDKVVDDTGPKPNISFAPAELNRLFGR